MGDPAIDLVSDRLEREIAELFVEYRLVGSSVGLVRDQDLMWSRGFGLADLESRAVPDENTIFRVASNTKTFTATAIFQLRDQGRLNIDEPLTRYVPEFASVKPTKGSVDAVTLRRLMCHHSGLMGEAPGEYWETKEFPTIEWFLAKLPEVEIVIEADSAFKYSNLAFAMLGEVVARVSGVPYEEYIHTNILGPLGMTSSVYELDDNLRTRMATGYQIREFEDAPGIAPHVPINGHNAAGQLYSTVADLARWMSFQFRTGGPERNGTQVLAGSTLAEMHRPQFMEPGWESGHCLPWSAARKGDQVFLGHGGGIYGFLTQTWFCPQSKLGLIWLTNGDGHTANAAITNRIIQTVAQAEAKLQKPPTFSIPVPTPESWRDFLGAYASQLGRAFSIEHRGGKLLIVTPPAPEIDVPPVELEPTEDPDTFMVTAGRGAGEPMYFRRDDGGRVVSASNTGFVAHKMVTH